MEANPKQQILRAIKDGKKFLLLSHKSIDGDGISSMAALYLILKKLGKDVTAYTPESIPKTLNFLPQVQDYISNNIDTFSDFIVNVDCTNAQVEKLRYKIIDNKVRIIITPKNGNFDESDVSTEIGTSQYDTIIVLDTGDLEHLGSVYTENPNLFYDSFVINIDHHATNTHFGSANLVNPKATSTCEIILGLVEALESQNKEKLLDKDIATYLLTGITVDTNSFQNSNTTPKSFSVAAQLLAFGADQQKIIKNLYKTHSLTKLKLWGRALSNIHEDKETKLVWSVISQKDFSETGTSEEDIQGLIDELMTSAPGADLVFLLREHEGGEVSCSLRATGSDDAGKLALYFNGGGHKKAAGFKIKGDSLEKIENYVVKKFRDYKLGNLDISKNVIKKAIEPNDSKTDTKEAEEFVKKAQAEANKEKVEKVSSKSTHSEEVKKDKISPSQENSFYKKKSAPSNTPKLEEKVISPKPQTPNFTPQTPKVTTENIAPKPISNNTNPVSPQMTEKTKATAFTPETSAPKPQAPVMSKPTPIVSEVPKQVVQTPKPMPTFTPQMPTTPTPATQAPTFTPQTPKPTEAKFAGNTNAIPKQNTPPLAPPIQPIPTPTFTPQTPTIPTPAVAHPDPFTPQNQAPNQTTIQPNTPNIPLNLNTQNQFGSQPTIPSEPVVPHPERPEINRMN